MKPIELYKLWVDFESMVVNTTLTDENKLKIGAEWLRALPPKQLCVSSTLSYEIVEEAMRGRLNDLKEKINGRTATTKKEEKGQESQQSKDGSRKKSVRKDATN
jgi:hypothetical protein